MSALMEARLKAEIWVQAYLRRLQGQGIPAFVVRKGEPSAGVVFVKLSYLDGRAEVFSQARLGTGEAVWMRATGEEPVADGEAEDYLARQVRYDPDLWIVEVEDRQGRHCLDS